MKSRRVTPEYEGRPMRHGLPAGGKAGVRRLGHARALRAAGGPARGGGPTATAPGVGRVTAERVRRRFVEGGLGRTLRVDFNRF